MATMYKNLFMFYFLTSKFVASYNFNIMNIHNINEMKQKWYPINMEEQYAFEEYKKMISDQDINFKKTKKSKIMNDKLKKKINKNIYVDPIPIIMLEQHGEVSMFE